MLALTNNIILISCGYENHYIKMGKKLGYTLAHRDSESS